MVDESESNETEAARRTAEFEEQANRAQSGLLAEFVDFLLHNKKWWLTPILVVLLLVAALIVLSGTAAAPFLYTLW